MRPSAKLTPKTVASPFMVVRQYSVLDQYWASMMRSPALVSPYSKSK